MAAVTEDIAEATRCALRRLASSVAVVTTRTEAGRFAMSVTAVTALSLDPPSLLVCINCNTSLHEPLAAGADFAINLLDRRQEEIARACGGARKGEARFAVGRWNEAAAPILEDAQAILLCRQDGQFQYGTHTIFIGKVVEALSGATIDPLIYADGAYGGLLRAS